MAALRAKALAVTPAPLATPAPADPMGILDDDEDDPDMAEMKRTQQLLLEARRLPSGTPRVWMGTKRAVWWADSLLV